MRSGKIGFLLCAGLVLAGGLMVVMMFIQVYTKNNEINELRSQVTAAREANQLAQQISSDSMNMNELYVFATTTLGMQEATAATTIKIRINSQSYTTSNLPVAEVTGTKVTFHWFD
ncbi:MAG: hypothetical protein J5589_00540 [Firmicutes bacterium]|nr:hypothetical protein [Bacillota bacterium]